MRRFLNPSSSSTPSGAACARHEGNRTCAAVEMALLEPRRLLAATVSDLLAIRVDNAIQVKGYADIWQPLTRVTRPSAKAQTYLNVDEFKPFALDARDLRAALARAPMEFTAAAGRPVEIALPTPDGHAQRFAVVETMVMDPKLAKNFANIRTYRGQGIDDPTATVRLDYTPLGFHAQVIAPGKSYYVDPYWHRSTSAYASYWRSDVEVSPNLLALRRQADELASPTTPDAARPRVTLNGASAAAKFTEVPGPSLNVTSGTQLRTFRTAVAATGEYTDFHGGSQAAGQAAIVTAINRVTGIYESELSIRLQLIANNNTLVFTNGATDPYTNDEGGTMLIENQNHLDSQIGSANYDIGHVFSTGGGGIAGVGVAGINGVKAWGVTGSPSPTGDAFWVDYVAHEMGHQFGAGHTFNTSTDANRDPDTAYEPGSGSTIMGYAGLTSDDLQDHSDPYFHHASFEQIINHVDAVIPLVGMRTNTGNAIPTVNAGLDYTIPAGTPFALTAVGSDADVGDALTYSWEQHDLGPANTLETEDNGSSPLFRVYNPTSSPTRTFPALSSILNGTNATPASSGGLAERLPTVPRAMDFRVTVRDNRSGGGGVSSDDMVVNVVDTGSAFSVTSFNAGGNFADNSTQTVTWNVAGTTGSGINAAQVNIRLSTDGGLTFPILLASAVPNDGSQDVVLPAESTTQGRIKVEPTNNVFFDISNANFTILNLTTPEAPTIGSLIASPNPVVTGQPLTLTADSAADANGDPITVSFYRETNGVAGLQPTGGSADTLLGTDNTGPYTWDLTAPAIGSYTYYARAVDPGNLLSNVVSALITVNAGDVDDQAIEAVGFTFGATVAGMISPAGDVDMFKFTVLAGQTVDIDIDLPASALDSRLRLFEVNLGDQTFTELATSDDNAAPGEPDTFESYLQHTFATAGTYYVGVSSWTNNAYDPITGTGDSTGGSGATGNYNLTITASAAPGTTNLSGTAGDDNWRLRRSPGGGANYEILINEVVTHVLPVGSTTSIGINLLGGFDTLTIDYVNGDPVPAGGVQYNGGGGAGVDIDTLLVTGSSGDDTINLVNVNVSPLTGNIALHSATGSATVEVVGVAGGSGNDHLVIDQALFATISYDGGSSSGSGAAGDTLIVNGSDAATLSATNILTGSNDVTYSNLEAVTLNALASSDVITINSTPATAVLTVNGDEGDDTFNVLQANGAPVTLNGGLDNDTFNVGGAVTGNVELIGASVTVSGGAGDDTLNYHDQNNGLNTDYALTATTVSRVGGANVTHGTVEALALNAGANANGMTAGVTGGALMSVTLSGGAGGDAFNVTPSAAASFRILGGDPTTNPGDALNLNPADAAGINYGPSSVPGYDKRLSFTNKQPIDFASIESTSGFDATAPTVDIVDVSPDPRNAAVSQITIVFSEAVSGFDPSNLALTRDGGANLLTGAQSLTSSDNITFVLNGLASLTGAGGSYQLALTAGADDIADITGNVMPAGVAATDAWITDATPPVVTDVFVAGSAWHPNFRSFMQTTGVGDATYGYRLTSLLHADELPWLNLDTISVRFSEDVTLGAGAINLYGVNTALYTGTVTYDPVTFTATWTRAGTFTADKLLLALNAAVIADGVNNALDGEWTNPAETTPVSAGGADTFPSGDGAAGGNFLLRMNVLIGDVNRDGQVVGNDVTNVRSNQGFVPGGAGYSIFRDINGDTQIVGNDVTAVRSRQGIALPPGVPTVPPAMTEQTPDDFSLVSGPTLFEQLDRELTPVLVA
jgi:hypothetical protein